eukprot:gene8050-1284_t
MFHLQEDDDDDKNKSVHKMSFDELRQHQFASHSWQQAKQQHQESKDPAPPYVTTTVRRASIGHLQDMTENPAPPYVTGRDRRVSVGHVQGMPEDSASPYITSRVRRASVRHVQAMSEDLAPPCITGRVRRTSVGHLQGMSEDPDPPYVTTKARRASVGHVQGISDLNPTRGGGHAKVNPESSPQHNGGGHKRRETNYSMVEAIARSSNKQYNPSGQRSESSPQGSSNQSQSSTDTRHHSTDFPPLDPSPHRHGPPGAMAIANQRHHITSQHSAQRSSNQSQSSTDTRHHSAGFSPQESLDPCPHSHGPPGAMAIATQRHHTTSHSSPPRAIIMARATSPAGGSCMQHGEGMQKSITPTPPVLKKMLESSRHGRGGLAVSDEPGSSDRDSHEKISLLSHGRGSHAAFKMRSVEDLYINPVLKKMLANGRHGRVGLTVSEEPGSSDRDSHEKASPGRGSRAAFDLRSVEDPYTNPVLKKMLANGRQGRVGLTVSEEPGSSDRESHENTSPPRSEPHLHDPRTHERACHTAADLRLVEEPMHESITPTPPHSLEAPTRPHPLLHEPPTHSRLVGEPYMKPVLKIMLESSGHGRGGMTVSDEPGSSDQDSHENISHPSHRRGSHAAFNLRSVEDPTPPVLKKMLESSRHGRGGLAVSEEPGSSDQDSRKKTSPAHPQHHMHESPTHLRSAEGPYVNPVLKKMLESSRHGRGGMTVSDELGSSDRDRGEKASTRIGTASNTEQGAQPPHSLVYAQFARHKEDPSPHPLPRSKVVPRIPLPPGWEIRHASLDLGHRHHADHARPGSSSRYGFVPVAASLPNIRMARMAQSDMGQGHPSPPGIRPNPDQRMAAFTTGQGNPSQCEGPVSQEAECGNRSTAHSVGNVSKASAGQRDQSSSELSDSDRITVPQGTLVAPPSYFYTSSASKNLG